ncbi:MAG: NAD(P)/FAD-dependent oxidoreductase [Solirubrobacteraceae bacterium]
MRDSYDAVVVGGGHNGLTAAAYLARAGRSVLVLERRDHVGGAAVSEAPWSGVDARVSRYSYLVSLLPRAIVDELGLDVRLVRRRISSYTPDPRAGGARGLLVDNGDADGTRASFAALGAEVDHAAWQRFYGAVARVAARVFGTVLEPLRTAADLRAIAGDDATWDALVSHPLGEALDAAFADDLVRGVVLTDALIGTFAGAHDADLRQNRCFLYHVIGNGTGDWDLPVGGMGAVSGALRDAALAAGAEIVTGTEVTAIGDGAVEHSGGRVGAGHILANVAPGELDRLRGRAPEGEWPEGAQLKVNLLLSRLPRLRDASVDPHLAFAGTLHVNETASQLEAAREAAIAGRLPDPAPCETYCHSLGDPTILGPELRASGAQTLTVFGLHMPARLFRGADHDAVRDAALAATLRSLDSVLAEPIADCILRAPDGEPCIEVRTPVELERELRLPGGNIFHRDLRWPWAEDDADVGRWGTETDDPAIHVCGAGARRGGGVSGIPGRNAAMAVLSSSTWGAGTSARASRPTRGRAPATGTGRPGSPMA